jgi:hypothetical protein
MSVGKGCSLVVALLCLGWLAPTYARGQESRPCVEDIQKFCKDVSPGGGRLIACLKEHENELSAPCKKKLEEAWQKAGEANQACADDVHKFCGEVKPGQGRIVKCLQEHRNELSPECKAKLEELRPPEKSPAQ